MRCTPSTCALRAAMTAQALGMPYKLVLGSPTLGEGSQMEVSGMRLLRSVWLAVFCLGSWGCDSLGTRKNSPASTGDLHPCDGVPEVTALQWEDYTELGSPTAAFTGIEGQCDGALRWSGDSEAKTGAAVSMHVEVQLDHASARLVQHTDRKQHSSGCPNELEVSARVALHSSDGEVEVSENTKTKVRYRPATATTFGFTLTPDEHRGSLLLQQRKGEATTLSFELDGAGANCAGEIMLSTTSTAADGTGRGAAGRLGSWSASGCPLGQTPFDIEQAIGDSTLPALIAVAWNERVFKGTWEDGAQAKLSLQVTPLTAASCAEQRAQTRSVTQPVEVRYSTDDGRLTARKTTANVRAGLTPEDELSELSLWISDEMTCSSTDSRLDYTPTDCTHMKAATVQLGLSSAGGADSEPADGGLNVYFLPRFGDELPDRDTLTLQ
jgi:hypothetical protein